VANRYPEAALIAARQGGSGPADPGARWEKALLQLYPGSPTSRKKSGPRGAFLGLCEEGLVKGIPAGSYSASKDNKAYAVQAAALLAEGTRSWSTTALWQAVTSDPEKKHSSQMDIVLALWKNGLIVTRP
jgi:hypothetical protein